VNDKMPKEQKHKFPDCLDYLSGDAKISYDDDHLYEDVTCSLCGKKIIWKYKLLGIFDKKDNLIKSVY